MQVIIDLPDELANQLAAKKESLAEIIERGLQGHPEGISSNWREILSFLATGPRPDQIISFRLSPEHLERSRELLRKNRENRLNEHEEAEMDEIERINHLMTLLKFEARS